MYSASCDQAHSTRRIYTCFDAYTNGFSKSRVIRLCDIKLSCLYGATLFCTIFLKRIIICTHSGWMDDVVCIGQISITSKNWNKSNENCLFELMMKGIACNTQIISSFSPSATASCKHFIWSGCIFTYELLATHRPKLVRLPISNTYHNSVPQRCS